MFGGNWLGRIMSVEGGGEEVDEELGWRGGEGGGGTGCCSRCHCRGMKVGIWK